MTFDRLESKVGTSRLALPSPPHSKDYNSLACDPVNLDVVSTLKAHIDSLSYKEKRLAAKRQQRSQSNAVFLDSLARPQTPGTRRSRANSIESFATTGTHELENKGTPTAYVPKPRTARDVFLFELLPQSVLAYLQHIKSVSLGLVGFDELMKIVEEEMDTEAPHFHRRGKRVPRKPLKQIPKHINLDSSPNEITGIIGRPLTPAEKLRAQNEAKAAALAAEELAERRRFFQKELGRIKAIVGADGKKIRDPEELRKEAERLRKEHEAMAAEERRKKQAQQAIIQAQVARIRKQIQDDVNEKEKQKKERMFHDNRFVFSMREKIKEEETWKSMDQSEEDRRVKYKYSLFRAKELEYEAHKKKYADEGREALVARVQKKERARARQLKKEQDERDHQKKLLRQKKARMKEARLKRKQREHKEQYRYKARSLRWVERYDDLGEYSYWENALNGSILYENPLEDFGVDIYEEYHEVWYKYFPSTDEDNLNTVLGGNWYRTVDALEEEREARAYQKNMEEYYNSIKDEYGGYIDEHGGYVDGEGGYTDAEGYYYDCDGNYVDWVGPPEENYGNENAWGSFSAVPNNIILNENGAPPPPPPKPGMPGFDTYVPPPPPPKPGIPGFDTYVPPPPPRRK